MDFLRDSGCESDVRTSHSELKRRVATLRGLLAMHLPHCRQYESLFAEYDTFDFCDWRHEGWYRLTRRLQVLESQLDHGVKFAKIARYGCVNYCYLAVDGGVVQDESEVPMGWGLLQRSGETLEVVKTALRLDAKGVSRLKLLERIARARSGRR